MRIQYLKIIQLTCFRICFVKQGGGVTFFKGSERGGLKKYSLNRNENLETPPPLLIKNDTSLIGLSYGSLITPDLQLCHVLKQQQNIAKVPVDDCGGVNSFGF